ncbi:MAG: tyrosine-type recombinase/integrase [Anaerolineaceae bacterium]|nr:tyrosine-type recombinase/integrase [Anaerolineaceae bacterium]
MPDFIEFANYLRQLDRSENTIHGYLNDLDSFSRWFKQSNGEEMSPSNITPIDMRDYRQFLLAIKGRSASTFNRHLAAIRSFVEWGVKIGIIAYNSIQGIKGIKTTTKQTIRWLNRKEQSALIRKITEAVLLAKTEPSRRQAIRDQSIVIVMLNTGLRLEEITHLKMEDVKLSERKGSLLVRNGKGLRSRTIPLNHSARQALLAWFALRPDSEYNEVFLSSHGKPIARRSIQHVFERLAKVTREDFSPHTLRHTFAKNLIDSGVGIEKVAMLLGHSSIETTRIYTTPSSQDLVKAVEGLMY